MLENVQVTIFLNSCLNVYITGDDVNQKSFRYFLYK